MTWHLSEEMESFLQGLKRYAKKKGVPSMTDYSQITGISYPTTAKRYNFLEEMGILKSEGTGRYKRYKFVEKDDD